MNKKWNIRNLSSLLAAVFFMLTAVIIFPVHAHANASGICSATVTWEFEDNGWLTIDGTGPMPDYKYSSDTPWSSFKEEVKNVAIMDGITHVGKYSFTYMVNLQHVYSSASVKTIGVSAFAYCPSLARVNKMTGLTSIGDRAFYDDTALEFIELSGSGLTSIGDYAFGVCANLAAMTEGIPSSVTSIGENAFDMIPNINYTGPAEGAPWGAVNLNGVKEGRLYYKDSSHTEIAACDINMSGAVVIPESVTKIGDRAFENCAKITSVSLPGKLTSIGNRAFYKCEGLTSIVIPNSVTSIGENAFFKCSKMTSANIPDKLTKISNGMFSYCEKLNNVAIPNSVTEIGDSAFSCCYNITSIVIPPQITKIGKYSFQATDAVSIQIMANLETIPSGAFMSNGKLKSITLPNSVKTIDYCAFESCFQLENITFGNQVESIGESAFKYAAFKTINLPDSVKEIGEGAFRECDHLVSLTAGKNLQSIGKEAFDACINLKSVVIKSVKLIDWYAFYNCTNLTQITLPGNLAKINDYAFNACDALTDIYYCGSKNAWDAIDISSAGNAALSASTVSLHLDYVIVNPDTEDQPGTSPGADDKPIVKPTVLNVGDTFTQSFVNYKVTKSGAAPEVTYVKLTKKKTSVTIPATVANNGITYKVTAVSANAFKKNKTITKLVIGTNVKSIGKNAFYGCSKLKAINIKTKKLTDKKVGAKAFKGIYKKATIKVPSSKKKVYKTFLVKKGIAKTVKIK